MLRMFASFFFTYSNYIHFLSRTSDELKKWLKLGGQRDKDSWEMYPSTVNAYFNPPANEVLVLFF